MYAVIETGGKQYRVEVGTELEIELIDAQPGQAVTLDRVLLVGDGEDTAIGQPIVANAAVEAEVLRRDRGDKVIVFKYRPKARHRAKKGHRQDHTVLRITDVKLGDKSAAALVRKQEQDAKTERQRLEEAAARQAAEDAALAAKLEKRDKAAKADTKAEAKPTAKADAKPRSSATRSTKARASTDATSASSEAKSKTSTTPRRSSRSKAPETGSQDTSAEAPKRRRTKKDE